MKFIYVSRILCLVGVLMGAATLQSRAQCELYDFYGNPSSEPYWYSCSGGDYTLNLQSPYDLGAWEVDWGDGSPVQTGPGLTPPTTISHTYSAAVDTFIVTFTEVNTGCTVEGVLVMEEATSASIQVPVGGLTQACAPQTMEFINSSTNTSETTTFTWDFGDGTDPLVFDHTNLGQTVSHTYQQGTVDCETEVTLTAENYCNTVQGGQSQASFSPIRIWDIDSAAISASSTLLCYPDTTVTFNNTTERNCLFQGNIYQRYEYWNFGDYWGEGQDSIIDWAPWPPSQAHTIDYPGIGTYQVTLLDSNLCGIDVATITVQIVGPPDAQADASADTVCVGETVTFFNNSSADASVFRWNFDDGNGWQTTGSGNVNHVYNTPGDYEIGLVAQVPGTTNSCSDTSWVPLVVLPGPDADIILDQNEGCDSLEVNYSDGSSANAVTWDWDFGNGQTSTVQDPGMIEYDTPGAYNVSLTVAVTNGCENSDFEVVNVYESPDPDIMVSDLCEGEVAQFTDMSTSAGGDPITSWDWDFGDGNTSTAQNPTHMYGGSGTYTVTLTVATDHCSATETFDITVNPAPNADFDAIPTSGCSPLEVEFQNNSTDGNTFAWNFGDGGISLAENPTHTFVNNGTQDSVYTVRLIVTGNFGCRDTATTDITVSPNAIADFNTDALPACAPLEAEFENNSVGAIGYEWDFGDGSPISTEEEPTHLFENNTLFVQNYEVQLVAISPNGCNDTTIQTVTAYPNPNFDFDISDQSGCSPVTVSFPSIPGVVSYYWEFGDNTSSAASNPTHFYSNSTQDSVTYTVTMIGTSAFGCQDTATSEVTVYPNPDANISAVPATGCSPLEVTFNDNSVGADSLVWDYGNGDSSNADTAVAVVYSNNGSTPLTYPVTLDAYNEFGCTASTSRDIEVYPEVVAQFEHPDSGCSPLSFQYDNQTVNAQNYIWNLGNGNVSQAQEPNAAYENPSLADSTFTVEMIATSTYGCSDTASSSLEVFPVPTSDFFPDVTSGCSPLDVTFTDGSVIADEYHWIYGDGFQSDTTASEHTHTFYSGSSTPQNYTVTLEVETDHGCTDESFREITVFPDVTANFTSDSIGCSPLTINFFNQSFGAVTYMWDFGDGDEAFIANPQHTFVNNGDTDTTYTVQMVAQSQYGCTDTAYTEVTVHPLPDVALQVDTMMGCHPITVDFNNLSSGADTYNWDFGDGLDLTSSDSTVTHVYDNGSGSIQSYTVTLEGTTINGCQESATVDVDIIPEVIAGFTAPEQGCSPFAVSFQNNSSGAFDYVWEFGDGDYAYVENPDHIYVNNNLDDETFDVTLIAQSMMGCADTAYSQVTVHSTPQANFTATPGQQQFPNSTIELENLSISGPADYNWDWGDGETTTSIDPDAPSTYTYDTWGQFDITLTIDNGGCSDEAVQTVIIDPPEPTAGFSGGGEGCVPYTVQFVNESEYGVEYHWDFGDGQESNVESPIHSYYVPGVYTVTLEVTGPGGETDVEVHQNVVTVHERATAFFTINPPVVNIPDEGVYFNNLSQGATDYHWDFGDGNTSTELNPTHFYQEEGWYTVTLVANNEFSCPDTFRVDEAVQARAQGELEFPNAFTPDPSGPSGGDYDIGDQFDNDIFFPVFQAVKEYHLQIYNRWGELLFESDDIDKGWDGYYRGELCPQDVYVWKVKAEFLDGNEVVKAGDVTLLR